MEIIKFKYNPKDIKQIKEIYLEAFPKREQKPFFNLKNSIKKGKVEVFIAKEDEIQGFIMCIPYKDQVLVDYLAVSSKIRSKGTGSKLIQHIIQTYQGKTISLLIEELDVSSDNYNQRVSRKNFYLRNGFTPSNIFIKSKGGDMEALKFGNDISDQEILELMEYALGKTYFKLSKMEIKK